MLESQWRISISISFCQTNKIQTSYPSSRAVVFTTKMEWSEKTVLSTGGGEKKKEEIQKVTSQVRISRRDTAKKREHRTSNRKEEMGRGKKKKKKKKRRKKQRDEREEVSFKRRIPMKQEESEGKEKKGEDEGRRNRSRGRGGRDRYKGLLGSRKSSIERSNSMGGRSDHRPQASFLVRCTASDRISSFLETSHEYFSPRHRPLAKRFEGQESLVLYAGATKP